MVNRPDCIQVDLEEFMLALQNHSYEMTWLLDIQTGDLVFAGDGMVNGEECDLDDFLDKDPDRYRIIESIDSSTGYRLMEDFIERLPHGTAQTKLRQAIERSKPFRNFKDTLESLGSVRDQWFAFELEAYRRLGEEWLTQEEIDAEFVIRRTSTDKPTH